MYIYVHISIYMYVYISTNFLFCPYHSEVDGLLVCLNAKMPVLDLHPQNLWPFEVDSGLSIVMLNEDSNETSSDRNLGTVDLLSHRQQNT